MSKARGKKASGSLKASHPRPQIERESSAHVNRFGKPKVAYLTEASATEAAVRRGAQDRSAPPNVYRCTTCGIWHVGGAASDGTSLRERIQGT
jgi:hypothetical protein